MATHGDPPVMAELMEWCFAPVPQKATRRQRVPLLFSTFHDIIHDRVPIVTVAGTSGKGTTCALLEAVLAESGHVCGVYTKPHLTAFRERFRVAGRCVTNDELERHAAAVFTRLRAFVADRGPEYLPTLYEALMLIAASLFAERGVTIAIYEAAVGGASCATSMLPATLCVVTSVDLDHQDELGFDVPTIAKDKAGIAPPGGLLVVGAGVSPSAREVILHECVARGVRSRVADGRGVEVLSSGMCGQVVRYPHGMVTVPFPGRHQALNIATVWQMTQVLHELGHVRSRDAIRGVERAKILGRFEHVAGAPAWLFDVAHNPASIAALIETIKQVAAERRFVCLFGATPRHDHCGMIELLSRWGLPIGFCEGFPRALSARQLADEAPAGTAILGQFETPAAAVRHCLSDSTLSLATVLVTGSLFLVGQCRHELARRGLLAQESE